MKRYAILLLLAGSTALSGCVAAALPVIAAGTYGGKKIFKKKDDDLPSSAEPAPAATPAATPAGAQPQGIPANAAIPSNPSGSAGIASTAPAAPVAGSVSPGMQFLYGSGEASALSVQAYLSLTDFLVARAADFAVGHPVNSVVLAPGSTLAAPKFITCGPKQRPAVVLDIDETALMNLGYEADDSQRTGAYDQSRWERWETTGVAAVDPVPGALEAIRAARASGIEVVFNSNRASANAQYTISALTLAGLGPVVHFENLWLKGDDGVGGSGKDPRRWAISKKYCVIAMVGDQLGDFSDLFNDPTLSPAQRRALTASPKLRMLWGHGWFVLPNPVYGTGLKGNVDDVFPKDRRWTDPGPGAAIAGPAAPPAPPPKPRAGTIVLPVTPATTLPPATAPQPAAAPAGPTPYGPVLPPEKK